MTKRWPITNCSGLSTSEFESNKVIEQRLFKNNTNTIQICVYTAKTQNRFVSLPCLSIIHFRTMSNIRNFAVPRGKHQQNKSAVVNIFGFSPFFSVLYVRLRYPSVWQYVLRLWWGLGWLIAVSPYLSVRQQMQTFCWYIGQFYAFTDSVFISLIKNKIFS